MVDPSFALMVLHLIQWYCLCNTQQVEDVKDRIRPVGGRGASLRVGRSPPRLSPLSLMPFLAANDRTQNYGCGTCECSVGDSCATTQQEQEQARSTENAEPNKGCTNKLGNVRDEWSVIVTKVSGLHANEDKTQ